MKEKLDPAFTNSAFKADNFREYCTFLKKQKELRKKEFRRKFVFGHFP